MLEYLEIAHFFDVAIAGDSIPNRKPAPDALLECARQLGVGSQEAVYVGDHPYDILAAQAAGMHVISVATGPTVAEELATYKPNRLLNRLLEVLDLPEIRKNNLPGSPD